MRAIACLLALGGVAIADAPDGRYRLEAGFWGTSQVGTERLPSCGQRVVDFIAQFDELTIEAGPTIKVDGTVWPNSVAASDMRAASREDLLRG